MVGGQALGALCVLDYVPRKWTAEQIEVLEDLAAGAATELELRNALGEAEARAQAETAVRRPLARAMSGDLEAESEEGVGTTVTVRLKAVTS